MPIGLDYEPPPAPPNWRRRFALVRAWAYALFFTAGLAMSLVITAVVLVRRGPSWGLLCMALPFLVLGSFVYQSVRSIVLISAGRIRSPFEDPPRSTGTSPTISNGSRLSSERIM